MNKYKSLSLGGAALLGSIFIYYKNKDKNYENDENDDKKIVSDVKKNFKNVKFKTKDNLIFHNKQNIFKNLILKYIYDIYEDEINNFTCYNERIYNYTEYRAREKRNLHLKELVYH